MVINKLFNSLLINLYKNMNVYKIFVSNGIAALIRIATMFGLNKIIAIYAGPSAYAYISQMQNLINGVLVLPTNALNNGVVKYTAEFSGDADKQQGIWKTSVFTSMFLSLIISIVLFIFNAEISVNVFNNASFGYLFIVLAFTIYLFGVNSFVLSFVNGLMKTSLYISINIITSIVSMLFSAVLIVFYGLNGALISLVSNQAVIVVISLWMCRKIPSFKWNRIIGFPDINAFKKLLFFSAIPITAGMTLPIAMSLIRKIIVYKSGWLDAGYFDAMNKISNMYLMIITSTLNVYYLPKLSSLNDRNEIVLEIKKGLTLVFCSTVIMGGGIYLFKDMIVNFIFTSDFKPILPLFKWQLIGDVFKMLSWVFGFYIMSKGYVKEYVVSEIFQWVFFVVLVLFFYSRSISLIPFLYTITQCAYLLLMFFVFKIKINKSNACG